MTCGVLNKKGFVGAILIFAFSLASY